LKSNQPIAEKLAGIEENTHVEMLLKSIEEKF